jgi:hypothetical protein
MIARRNALLSLSALALVASARGSFAAEPTITVSKDPNCGCCGHWVEHLQQAGFVVEVRDVPDINRVKARLGVPADLAACHTAEIAGYVIEGHVPASSLRRFLAEKPNAKGIAVKGMPVGSPGMEVPGAVPEEYEVVLFGPQRRIYARFRETTELR